MGVFKLQLPEELPSRSLQDKAFQTGAWEPTNTSAENPSFRQGLPESRLQGCKSAGWYIALIKHVRNLQVTIHGLDFGILAEMTAILAWLDLCNDESRNLGTSRVSAPDVALSL